ncbi:MAG: DUF255 domain-containing protein [Bacteroidia bacterium]
MKIFVNIGLITVLAALAFAFMPQKGSTATSKSETQINWVSMEEASELANTTPKKVLVDVYTDWCGWCKRMDKATYEDPKVVAYINEHFYAVKFDAEQHEDVVLGDRTFKFRADAGRRGVHELAVAMMDGKMSYPTTIFLMSNCVEFHPSRLSGTAGHAGYSSFYERRSVQKQR